MKYDLTIYHRRSIRLKGFDYSQSGVYFVTLCSHNRECLFGEISNNKMLLNPYGMIVHDEWMKSTFIRSEIELDEFIIMPNHIHGIVFIHKNIGQNKENSQFAPSGPKNKSISSFVAGFKSAVTKRINEMREIPKALVWQRNYYEHIIRNEKSLKKIREYVIYNPQTWENDSLFHYL